MMRFATILATTLFLAAPAFAQQSYTPQSMADYEACKKSDRNNQILGTVVGGLVGGFVGDKIEKGEGTVIGGAAGAYAGNRIANKDCSKLLVPSYSQTSSVQSQDQTYITYDMRSGQYIDTRTGAVVSYPNGTTTYAPQTQVLSRTSTQQSSAPAGMVRVTDPQTGSTFLVSQADYDRHYRN